MKLNSHNFRQFLFLPVEVWFAKLLIEITALFLFTFQIQVKTWQLRMLFRATDSTGFDWSRSNAWTDEPWNMIGRNNRLLLFSFDVIEFSPEFSQLFCETTIAALNSWVWIQISKQNKFFRQNTQQLQLMLKFYFLREIDVKFKII